MVREREKSVPICIECDKKNQKDLPLPDSKNQQSTKTSVSTSPASKGMPCEESYAQVTSCMNDNGGQISACKQEWDFFRMCHDQNKR